MFLIRLASRFLLPFLLLLAAAGAVAAEKKPVYVGLDAELGYAGSTSAQAIRMGMLIAMEEVNQAGGVLDGRPLRLIERDNKGLIGELGMLNPEPGNLMSCGSRREHSRTDSKRQRFLAL